MRYKILKDYVNWNRDTIKAGGTVELGETPATSFYGALLANGFIKEIEEGEFGDGDTYWCVNSRGRAYECYWANDKTDKFRLSQGNAFHTIEEAEDYLEYLKAKAVLRADTKGNKHGEGAGNWYVFRLRYKLLKGRDVDDQRAGTLYFASREDTEDSIDTHAKEWHLVLDYELKNGA